MSDQRQQNVFIDPNDPGYPQYWADSMAYRDRVLEESADYCVELALRGPDANSTDPGRIAELVVSSLVIDVLNVRWGGRAAILAELRRTVLAALPRPERRGRR
jgi:hypothetical protein